MDYAVDLRDYPEEVVKKFLAQIEKVSTIKWANESNPTDFFPTWGFVDAERDHLVQAPDDRGSTVLTRDQFIAKMAELYPKKKQDIREYCKEHRCWAMRASGAHKPKGWYCADQKPVLDIARSSWVHNYMHDSVALDESKLIFPDVPWDKSLIAPDGSMPLMEKKEEKKQIEKFVVGKWYKWTKPSGTIYFSSSMDKIKNKKSYKCINVCSDVDYRGTQRAAFDGIDGGVWWWPLVEFEEVLASEKKPSKPSRGDPVFVWDDGYDDTIPASVMYFHHSVRSGVVVFAASREKKSGIYYDHYREFDASLVGVPRREWP